MRPPLSTCKICRVAVGGEYFKGNKSREHRPFSGGKESLFLQGEINLAL
jgi:hypothetical protein